MYSYNNVPTYKSNIPFCSTGNCSCSNQQMMNRNFHQVTNNPNDDRLIGPFLGPLLLGGIAGYALRPPYPAPYPVPAPYPAPYPVSYSTPYMSYAEPTQIYTSNSYYY